MTCRFASFFVLLSSASCRCKAAGEDECSATDVSCLVASYSHDQLPFKRLGAATLRGPGPQIRDRECLPDSHLPWMPEVLPPAREDFPAVFHYDGVTDVEAAGRHVDALLANELARFGVVVIKGLPLTSPDTFSQLMHSTNMTLVDYIGGVTSRPVAAPKVTPASTEPPFVSMEPHMDNPYWPVPPARLVLFVGEPPKAGGQALVSDTRGMLRDLRKNSPEVLEEFQKRHVRYEHFYPDQNASGAVIVSWQTSLAKGCSEALACDPKATAEAAMRAKGFEFEWIANGLKRWEVIPPVLQHPVTGEEAWANMLTAMHCTVFDNHPEYPDLNRPVEKRNEPCDMHGEMPYHTTFGDGGNVPVPYMHAVRRAQWDNSVSFDYAAGDLMVIDNYHAMHGRIAFEPPRELYLTMVGR